MAKRKKKTSGSPQKFSPTRYIREKARNFPIEACYINSGYAESGLAQIVVLRKQPSGKLLAGVYLVDIFCVGLKDTFWRVNQTEEDLQEIFHSFLGGQNQCEYEIVHNLIYGAIDYAEELGFEPHPDFRISRYILEPDTEAVPYIEMEFGKDGKPLFISGPHDDVRRITRILNNNVGVGNWEYMTGRKRI